MLNRVYFGTLNRNLPLFVWLSFSVDLLVGATFIAFKMDLKIAVLVTSVLKFFNVIIAANMFLINN